MKNRFVLLFIFSFFSSLSLFSATIAGGSLTYDHVGSSTYRITLKLYKDCNDSVAFPTTVDITVTLEDGTVYSTISIPFQGVGKVQSTIDTCIMNPVPCLEEAVYSKSVNNLPSNIGGYHLYFQYCCRGASFQNIVTPSNTGDTWYTHIPGDVFLPNSSPKWLKQPPVFVCLNDSISINHSAMDADGDSLYYSLYTPYNGDIGAGALDPTFPGNVFTVPAVVWSGTYSANNPLNATLANSLTINSNGTITGAPPALTGKFVTGVRCQEWRNGALVGEILRDFQFNVVNCSAPPVAGFTSMNACNDQTVLFTNTSIPSSNTYSWIFGNNSTLADTSSLENPSYTYPDFEGYTATLIINKGTSCADTVSQQVILKYIIPDFMNDSSGCRNTSINFQDTSRMSAGSSIVNWSWDFGDTTISTIANPVHSYSISGNHPVTLIVQSSQGCIDTVTKTVHILQGPKPLFVSDDYSANVNQTVHFTDQSTNAVLWNWNFGDASSDSTSSIQNPAHIYTNGGIFNVCLAVTDNDGCSDTVCNKETVSLFPSVPSGFSPNDDGQNDIFYVYGGPFKSMELKIYNNWGELIFESNKQSQGWDGKYKGEDQPIGVYVYVLVCTTEDNEQRKLSGDVTLLR